MKKYLLAIFCLIVISLGIYLVYINSQKNNQKDVAYDPIINYELTTDKDNYKEYRYSVTGDTLDNESKLALEKIQQDPASLSYGAKEIDLTNELKDLTPQIDGDYYNSFMVYQIGENQYTFDGTEDQWDHYDYAIYENDNKLFERHFCFPNKRTEFNLSIYNINNQLAFTFDECFLVEGKINEQDFTTDLYYAGEYINEKYGIKNTTKPFAWNNKLGFFTKKDDLAYVYFDGQPIGDSFTGIHTTACCADFGLLPKLYDNGVLVFAAGRNKTDFYIVEIKLD
ncbi:MAG TPA: hypothetical protein DEG44_00520 [Candidatus Kerfeldbacteria bacterium]|nr:hypothetical protein [Candidatus Kerfeldbacteria bacterium]